MRQVREFLQIATKTNFPKERDLHWLVEGRLPIQHLLQGLKQNWYLVRKEEGTHATQHLEASNDHNSRTVQNQKPSRRIELLHKASSHHFLNHEDRNV